MNREDERHYRVVRYYPAPGKGLLEDTLGSDLTLREAEHLVQQNPPVSHEEEVVVVDQEKPPYDDEVTVTTLRG
jgi:hypothetical protein